MRCPRIVAPSCRWPSNQRLVNHFGAAMTEVDIHWLFNGVWHACAGLHFKMNFVLFFQHSSDSRVDKPVHNLGRSDDPDTSSNFSIIRLDRAFNLLKAFEQGRDFAIEPLARVRQSHRGHPIEQAQTQVLLQPGHGATDA